MDKTKKKYENPHIGMQIFQHMKVMGVWIDPLFRQFSMWNLRA